MSDSSSTLQKLCLQTIKSGAVHAFTDLFRLTHLVQPLSANQPQTYEDIIATAGPDAPGLISEFSFDNPLSMPLKTLTKLQQYFETADNCGLQKQLYAKFIALSKISDVFLNNHKLREKVKMNPLVMPFALYENLQTTRSEDILQLIDSEEFVRAVDSEGVFVQAIAQTRDVSLEQQIFVPVVINYALMARNALFEHIIAELRGLKCDYLYELMDKAQPENPSGEVSQIMELHFILLLTSCFLRLAYSLNQFGLYKASYVVFEKFLACTEHLETLLGAKFSEKFSATNENGYLRLLEDDHINLNKDKKDDNLAYANLELSGIPRIFDSILDRCEIYNAWSIEVGEFKVMHNAQTAQEHEENATDDANAPEHSGNIEALAEFVYAGRMYAIENLLLFGCSVFSQQKDAGVTLRNAAAVDAIVRGVEEQADGVLTVEQLEEPKLNFALLCSYNELIEAVALFEEATDNALKFDIFCMKMPAFKRLCELVSRLERYELAESYADSLILCGGIFEINALAWKARWARQMGKVEERYELLKQRYDAASEALAESSNEISLLAQQKQTLATKYAVAAASELTFASLNNEGLMEDAWNNLQQSSEADEMGNTVIEARVRYGAVKSKESVEKLLGSAMREEVEEGHDEDLDSCLLKTE